MYSRYQSNKSCKLTADRVDAPDLVIRDLISFYSLGLRMISNFRNMHMGGGGDITTLNRGSKIWVGEVISHKNLDSLLVPKRFTVLNPPTFKGSS